MVGHHHDGHGGPNTTNFKHYYHPKQLLFLHLCPKITPGGVPDQVLLLAVGVVGHHHDGHGGLNTTNFTYYYHPKHFLFLHL